MAAAKNKYNSYAVLANTGDTFSPKNKNLIELFIEIKDTQNEWFLLRYVNYKPEMWRIRRRGLSKTEQQGPELEKEKGNLGKVEVEKDGKPFAHFHDYDSFWKKINDRGK